ncbi:MAG TPA: bifunctional diguanylate cyclase/phosphodiesterase [Gammaproteobacteria bacterium]|nr:bifunctional diguanylate cyclase/phosphodiesterase [Gammaproteobacteria bacterium]
MNPSLQAVISNRQVTCLFQPIMDVTRETLLGYEALARGPTDSALYAAGDLFAAAATDGQEKALDLLCFETAVARRAELGLGGNLFVNLTSDGLLALGAQPQLIRDILARHDLAPGKLIFELTEQAIVVDYKAIRAAMRQIRAIGVEFAIDDLGSGYSGLRTWTELKPAYVKINRYFISSIDTDALKVEFVRAIVELAGAAGSTVIAEGVETAGELAELRKAGIELLQGFHIAPPRYEPIRSVTDTMIERVELTDTPKEAATASDLVFESFTIEPSTSVSEVAQLFHDRIDLQTLAVVRDQRPIGVIRRCELLDMLSLPLRKELFGDKPIAELMDKNPLLIEADLKLEQVSRIVTRGYQERLQEQFVITLDGSYLGMGRVIDLLRAITQEQVNTARQLNPLTMLPGNVPINDCVNGLLRRDQRFTMCHIDIDNFKPFNDFYGYAKGDQALVTLSRLLVAQACPLVDFVGHVGGDDFVAIFRSADWQLRIARLFNEISEVYQSLYRQEHIEQDGFVTRDRYGLQRHIPMLSLSVAAIVCESTPQCTAEDLAYMVAPIKMQAKQQKGNSLIVEDFASLVAAESEFDELFASQLA